MSQRTITITICKEVLSEAEALSIFDAVTTKLANINDISIFCSTQNQMEAVKNAKSI